MAVTAAAELAAARSRDLPLGKSNGVREAQIRKMEMSPRYISASTVGHQLVWGAAEPLRRMLNIATGNL